MTLPWQQYKDLEQIPEALPAPQPIPAPLHLLIPFQRGIVEAAIWTFAPDQQHQHLEKCFDKALNIKPCKHIEDEHLANPVANETYGVTRANLMATWFQASNMENATESVSDVASDSSEDFPDG